MRKDNNFDKYLDIWQYSIKNNITKIHEKK